MSTTLYGLTTIRAFKSETQFSEQFDRIQNTHTSAYFMFLCSTRWFGIVLDVLCAIYVISITILLLVNIDNSSNASEIALSISQALLLTDQFQSGVRQSAELESLMTSVERIDEFCYIPREDVTNDNKIPPENWPSNGEIKFKGICLEYESSDCLVLNDFNFEIRGGEKVGIVGRTGSGKSSIIEALFRLTQPKGLITIDGINTSSIGLSHLRKNISIIPQEPILFTGTVRTNIDPFNERSDQRLWEVLEKVQLKKVIQSFPSKLDHLITESGNNLSVGQKQLICLVRAILRDNKIIVLDEVTANVDHKYELLIHYCFRYNNLFYALLELIL
jgi:ATP-binding cassette subfamily C (CFTR/MRP) protein 4